MSENITQRTYRVAWDQDELVLDAYLTLEPNGRPQLWNGWVCPEFDRANIDKYIAFIAAMEDPDPYERAEWQGDTLVLTNPDYPDDPAYLEPCEHGRWGLGAWEWTWYVVGDDEEPLYERWKAGEVL